MDRITAKSQAEPFPGIYEKIFRASPGTSDRDRFSAFRTGRAACRGLRRDTHARAETETRRVHTGSHDNDRYLHG